MKELEIQGIYNINKKVEREIVKKIMREQHFPEEDIKLYFALFDVGDLDIKKKICIRFNKLINVNVFFSR
jgi:hypothetical protein